MKDPSNKDIHNELVSFRNALLDDKMGVISGDTGILKHLEKLNDKVHKNTKWRWQTKAGLGVILFVLTYFGIDKLFS